MSSTKYKEHLPNYAVQSSKNNTKRLDYYKRLQAVLDANATKRQSLLMRKNMLDHCDKYQYNGNFDKYDDTINQRRFLGAFDQKCGYDNQYQ